VRGTLRPRRKIAAVAAALAVAVVAIAWIARMRAQPVARVRIACVPGQAHRFTLDYTSHGELVDGALGVSGLSGPGNQVVDIAVHGRATETCVESGPGNLVFALAFADVAGEADAAAGAKQPASELLVGTTFVDLAPDGIVRTIRFGDGMSSLAQNIVRDVLSHRSMKLPPGGVRAWRSDEASIDGAYAAEYRIESATESAVRLRKQRVSPSAPRASAASRPRARYRDGTLAEIHISHAWLADLDSTTDVEVVSGKKIVSKSRTHVALHRDATELGSAERLRATLALLRASRAAVGDLAASDVDRRLDEKIQRDELGDDTWATLWDRSRGASPDRPRLFLKMRALFTLDPARCKDAAAALATRDSPKDDAFMIVASALGATGSPEAQAALRDAIAALAGKRDHQEVLIAELGTLDNPDRATEAYARDIVAHPADGEVRNVAQLALGNMARTLNASETDRSEALVSEALQQANSARTLDDRLVSIYTLGNTGSPRALAVLQDAVSDPDDRVRQAAAAALRFVEGPDVEQLLLTLAATDLESSVRADAAQSLRQRSVAPATFDALAELVRRDPSETVRQTLISVISERAEQFPGALGVLDWVAQHDPKQDVRRTAQLALLRLRGQDS
jgi:HEAT repeat protein